jgi:hydroxyethylthiazole kinase-like sugar kinase family protein
VGIGATAFRKTTANGRLFCQVSYMILPLPTAKWTQELLNTWQASVIKGNGGELATLANSDEVGATQHMLSASGWP